MKRLITLTLGGLLLLLPVHGQGEPITIYYQNDIHSWLPPSTQTGGILKVLELIKQECHNGPTFYTVAGDLVFGPAMDQGLKGIIDIQVWNLFLKELANTCIKDRVVVALGNHDLELHHIRSIGEPIVANILDEKENPVFKPYRVYKEGGLKVGFLGLVLSHHERLNQVLKAQGLKLNDPYESALHFLREMGELDLTVLVIHDSLANIKGIARRLPRELGVDLIISGHSHAILDPPLKVNDIYILQGGAMNQYLGRARIHLEQKRIKYLDNALIPLYPSELLYALMIMKESMEEARGKTIGLVKKSLVRPGSNGSKDTSLGNLVTDAMRWAAQTHIAIVNNDIFRQDILVKDRPLPFKEGDINTLMPYGNKIVKVEMKGEDILKFLEGEKNGPRCQVSGLSYTIELKKDKVQIKSIIVNERPLDKNGVYTCAINSYLIKPERTYEYLHLNELKVLEILNDTTLNESVIAYIKMLGSIDYEPGGNGRINILR